ncbi:MAG: GNAT family N-acetyltransferase [Tolypothrix brevis GSE-NOS-MK-07-07A]|nr:GNAT family N-acetyltransferase [Tolypothrix brevis GSE-NOS-MK-07-07A]
MLNPESVDFCIEQLEKHHDRASFSCGNEQLDRFNLALSMSGINLEQLPQSIVKKLPKYPIIGVTLIGRLAVAHDYRGYGWGKLLIMDALYRSLAVSQRTGCFAVVVDAIDDKAVRFYQRFEFQTFPDQPYKLFRTMKNIAQTFGLLPKN